MLLNISLQMAMCWASKPADHALSTSSGKALLGCRGKLHGFVMIGEDMTRCLAFLEMKNSTGLYPFLRLAMWSTMMQSTVPKDGISRILVKADADKLKDMKMREQVDEVEQLLADSWELLQSCGLDEAARVGAYGRLAVRLILKLTNKEKLGREPAGFDSYQDIAKLFAAELQKNAKAASSSSATAPGQELKVHNLIEADAAQVALLKNSHMELGKLQLGRQHAVHIVYTGMHCMQGRSTT